MSSLNTATATPLPPPTLRVLSSSSPLTAPSFYRPPSSHPPHWKSKDPLHRSPRGFSSPWESDDKAMGGLLAFAKIRLTDWNEKPITTLPLIREATFLGEGEEGPSVEEGKLRYTWLGHAACHLQIPIPVSATSTSSSSSITSTRSLKVLTDPVFSQRCSPFQFAGPARYTQCPTSVSELAQSDHAWPDVILISHNHYDHLDYSTMRLIAARPSGRQLPTFVVPLGLAPWFRQNMKELPKEKLVELDWWEERTIEATFKEDKDGAETMGRLRVVCTPAQHFSGRGLFDRDQTLWASYALHVLPPSSEGVSSSIPTPSSPLARIWFSGDTGYRSNPSKNLTRQEESKLPHCPAFSEIGSLLGPFDLSLIACGAYDPKNFMSRVHIAPHESIAIHQEIKSKKTFGIHHSTFRLTPEEVNEPSALLIEEARKAGLKEGEVENLVIGETRIVPIQS